ncbi:MAG: type II CRISPR-associated endonuclease Cas1 [Candidatus Eutrophobiaceae bacterium]
MPDQILEISSAGFRLSKSRGFLEVSNKQGETTALPLDDILVVLLSHPACTISTVLIDDLATRNIPLVICGKNYLPTAYTLPISKNQGQFKIMNAQLGIGEPKKKRLWQKIVKRKILNQAGVLERTGNNPIPLKRLATKVKSGDPENCEAQAARIYWQALFGKEFRREQTRPDLNAVLNYAYAIVRACVARGICGAGLHPTLSLHHKNPTNPFNLADDLMEPYRPIADMLVWMNQKQISPELNPKSKARIAAITHLLVFIEDELSPLSLAILRTCRSLASCYLGEGEIALPYLPEPIQYAAL